MNLYQNTRRVIMEIKEITRSFNYTVKTILHAKLRNFRKKSLWGYLILSLPLAFGVNVVFDNEKRSLLITYLIILITVLSISLAAIVISSYVLYTRKKADSMDVTFSENQIDVNWTYKGVKEEKNWDWIKGVEEANDIYYFDLNVWPKNVIMISKQSLTSDENNALRYWVHINMKMKASSNLYEK
jgi:hypothetical protein